MIVVREKKKPKGTHRMEVIIMTKEQFEATYEIINNTEWVMDQVNKELANGRKWNDVMQDVAEAFGIIK